jgi:arylsulfatase A-like enzyme
MGKMRICFQLAAVVLIGTLAGIEAQAQGRAKHVVIVVMDGLRRDSVVDADMPNLAKLAKEGTFFAAHHSVYVTSTEVNGTALATGMRPGHSGVVGNREYRPDVELLQPVDAQGEWAAWKGDQVTGGKWINAQTLPQLVRAGGGRTVVAGTKPVALLWDRSWEGRTVEQPTVYSGDTIPGAVKDRLVQSFGPIPPSKDNRYFANGDQDQWTTRALTDKLWDAGVPELSLLWLSEPDFSQHGTGPGSALARKALRSSDDCLGKLLATLESAKLRDQTDVLVVSDHGFSTVAAGIDIMDDLHRHGFDVGGAYLDKPEKGSIMMVGLGGSVAFYVIDHDAAVTARLVKHLQGTPYAGVLFSRDGLEGTFKTADAGIDSPAGPDVMLSMRWTAERLQREGAMPGALLASDKGYRSGTGSHGSLSRFELANTLIAAGPDFKAGFKSEMPSGNLDVAPTVLRILGIAAKEQLEGRVLEEAMVGQKNAESPKVETTVIKAERALGDKTWRQYLKVSTVGDRRYYDEGNAGAGPEK